MNKAELIDVVAARANCTKRQASEIVTVTVETIMEEVAKGEKVTLVGFGSFEPRDRKEREGRNPRTGEVMTMPATRVPGFSAGKLFKELVAG